MEQKCKRDPRKEPIFLPESPQWRAGVQAARSGMSNPDMRNGIEFVEGWIVGRLFPLWPESTARH